MKFLLLALLLSLLLGQLGALPISAGITIYIHDVVVVAILILFLLRGSSIKRIFEANLAWPILAFDFAAILSLVFASWNTSGMEVLKGSLYLWRFMLYTGIYFAVQYSSFKPRSLMQMLFNVGVGFSILGFVQYFFYPNLRNIIYLGWDPHYYRLVSTFLDPNFAGIFLVLAFILGLAFIPKNKNRIFFIFTQLFIFIAVLLTYSRSSLVALVVSVAIWSLILKKWALAGLIALFIILGIWILPQRGVEILSLTRSETAIARVGNWQESLMKWQESPIFGFGFNTLRYVFGRTIESKAGAGVDNSLLFVLLTTGIAGLAAYIWLLWKIAKVCWRNFHSGRDSFGVVVLASWSAVLVHSLFNNSLFYPWVMMWLWILTGTLEKEIKEKTISDK